MLDAIIGDIVDSVYEWNLIKTKDFPYAFVLKYLYFWQYEFWFHSVLSADDDMLDLRVFGAAHLFSQVRSTQPTLLN